MDDFRFSKRALPNGWAEIRVVMMRDVADTPDYELVGMDARRRFAGFILAGAAGIASMFHRSFTEAALNELLALSEQAFAKMIEAAAAAEKR